MDVKRTSHAVALFGTYTYDTDLFQAAMTQTVAELRERVQRGCEGMESGTRTKVNKLRKADLAAMVAEWDTGARDNERQAEQDEEHNPAWVDGFPPVAEVPEPTDDDVDPEFAAEVDALVAADLAPETTRTLRDAVAPLVLPITETDVQAANVDVVVQLRKRLYNGKLIAVVNRRTAFSNPICATVEVGGVRFLVNADDLLAA